MSSDDTNRARGGLTYKLREDLAKGALSDRKGLTCLTLLLTYRCPAACDHCVFESDNTRSEALDPEVARRVIEAAGRRRPPPGLSFSGGEPFLKLALMRELMSLGASLGMRSEVVTSAAWAKGEEHATATLRDLQERGLGTVCVSYDRYHAPFVEAAKVRAVALAGLSAGLRVVVNTALDPTSTVDPLDYLRGALDLSAETLDRCFVNRLVTVPVGRARKSVLDYDYSTSSLDRGCAFSTEVVTLSPYGLLYPCCGSVVGEDPEKAALYVHDDLGGKSVDEIGEILEAVSQDLFFKLLQRIGPYRLLQEIWRANPGLATRRRFTSDCDVCLELTQNAEVASAARELLRGYAARLAGETA